MEHGVVADLCTLATAQQSTHGVASGSGGGGGGGVVMLIEVDAVTAFDRRHAAARRRVRHPHRPSTQLSLLALAVQ